MEADTPKLTDSCHTKLLADNICFKSAPIFLIFLMTHIFKISLPDYVNAVNFPASSGQEKYGLEQWYHLLVKFTSPRPLVHTRPPNFSHIILIKSHKDSAVNRHTKLMCSSNNLESIRPRFWQIDNWRRRI